jgi:hypothetical protein
MLVIVTGDERLKLRRDLQPVRGRVQDREVILLRDPLALSSQVVALGVGAIQVLQLLDGTRDLPRLRLDAIHLAGGDVAAGDDAQQLVEVLDERCLLDNGRFRESCRQVLEEWRSVAERPPAFVGSAYPSDATELSRSIEDVLDHAPEIGAVLPPGRLVALVAPHIDLAQGWAVYGAAYGLLAQLAPEPERILVMGTGHAMEEDMLCPTDKRYRTPLGLTDTDEQTVAEVRVAGNLGEDDLAHRGEHSAEFQIVFLQHLYADDLPPLVPLLCGDASRHLDATDRPSELPGVAPVIEKLHSRVESGQTLVVAGVDLCHVGPKFGHREPSSSLLAEAVEHETALIDALERVDPAALWAEARRVSDRYHVCGLSSLGILLELLPEGTRGALLCRDVMREEETASAVGHAALAFFHDPGG